MKGQKCSWVPLATATTLALTFFYPPAVVSASRAATLASILLASYPKPIAAPSSVTALQARHAKAKKIPPPLRHNSYLPFQRVQKMSCERTRGECMPERICK
eukprot:695051-Rhodomonas_salina.2